MRHPRRLAAGLAALALPAPLLAQGATDQYAVPTPTAAPVPVVAPPPPPEPKLGKTVVLERISGKVRYTTPAAKKPAKLGSQGVAVPMHTTVNALRGRVRVTVARDRRGRHWRSLFFDGRFQLSQPEHSGAVTEITMTGGSFAGCAKASIARKRSKHARVRRLWGDGHGRFRTSGRYSAATVRGTKWLVEDRCDGTLTRVARGVVDVEDFTVPPPKPVDNGEGVTGGGQDGSGSFPAPAPAPTHTVAPSRPRHVKVRKGQSYVAGPGG